MMASHSSASKPGFCSMPGYLGGVLSGGICFPERSRATQRQGDPRRGNNTGRGYGVHWQRLRKASNNREWLRCGPERLGERLTVRKGNYTLPLKPGERKGTSNALML